MHHVIVHDEVFIDHAVAAAHIAVVGAVDHECVVGNVQTIEGIKEDVTDIVLNLKSLALRLHSDVPKRMYLKVRGPAVVTAGMIEDAAMDEAADVVVVDVEPAGDDPEAPR